MSDHERGAYTPPTDAALSFDARQPVRGARPVPFTLIISVLVLLGLGAAIFAFYHSGVRRAGQAPQIVGAPVGGMKAPPPAEAQPQDPAAGLQIYKTEGEKAAASGAPVFVAPPEEPQTRQDPTAPPPAPQLVLSPAAPAPAPAIPAAAAKPATAAPALRPSIPAQPPAPAKPVQVAKAEPSAAKPPPLAASAPVAKPGVAPPAKAAAPKVVAKSAAPASAATSTGVAAVQIGAFSSQTLADKGWNDAAALAPGAAAGKGKSVEKVDRDGKTLFRTQVTGFASRAEATAFCDKLKAAGKACFVK
jgi:cytoskeletal protein RodZ